MKLSKDGRNMSLIFLLTISIFSTNAAAYQPFASLKGRSLSMDSTSDSQLLYADALFEAGDYDGAILEFKRYIFYNPQSDILDYALYRIGQSHYYSRRPADAQKRFERLLKDYPQSPFLLYARFMLGKTFMDSEDFPRARSEFHLIIKSSSPHTRVDERDGISAQAKYLEAWSYLLERDWYSAVAEFRKVSQFQPDSQLSIKAERFADEIFASIRLPRKSPTLARWMSTFIPGSGQIYAGRITNGLISTAFNAAFIYLLVDSIRDKRYVDAAGIYIIGARFYWGNIYNAAQSALEYNQRIEERLLEKLMSDE